MPANFYGIANFANDFNKVRDDSLTSGFRAKDWMRHDYLSDYKMPEQMLQSDVNSLQNSIKADTLQGGYGDYVQAGLNDANIYRVQSDINRNVINDNREKLQQFGGDQITSKANEARFNVQEQNADELFDTALAQMPDGLSHEDQIAYMSRTLAPNLLGNQFLGNRLKKFAYGMRQNDYAAGTAMQGTAGTKLMNSALPYLGYPGLTATQDANGNLVYRTGDGDTSAPVTVDGWIPSGGALFGNPAQSQQYWTTVADRTFKGTQFDADQQRRIWENGQNNQVRQNAIDAKAQGHSGGGAPTSQTFNSLSGGNQPTSEDAPPLIPGTTATQPATQPAPAVAQAPVQQAPSSALTMANIQQTRSQLGDMNAKLSKLNSNIEAISNFRVDPRNYAKVVAQQNLLRQLREERDALRLHRDDLNRRIGEFEKQDRLAKAKGQIPAEQQAILNELNIGR